MNTIISMSKVCKSFQRGDRHVSVLNDVSLDVAEREFVALMGPSGSGKTTLLNLVAGLARPDEGRVVVAGADLESLSAAQIANWRARSIGFVFQLYNLMPGLSAEENVEVPLYLTGLGRSERKRRARAALTLVNLSDRGAHRPGELSGGQQQRVAIARAIAADALILVCDEPTGDLDRAASDSILALLQLLNREHAKTIVMVTHDDRAAAYASRQIRLDKGALLDHSREANT